MNRRSFLGTLTAASLTTVLDGSRAELAQAQDAAPKQDAKSNFQENATVILVHAAWADGSCWSNTILPLERKGLKVVCAPIPLTSLTNDVTALKQELGRTSGPVILVGHAYSGAVIAAVQGDYPIKALVYITALAPDEGETVAKIFYHEPPGPEAPKMVPDSNGLIWMPDDAFARALTAHASADQSRIAAALQRPLSVPCIQEPAPTPLWKSKPTWFLIAEDDRMISPKTQRFMAERMGAKIRSHHLDHTPMVSEPAPVVDIILEAARETLSV
jgi:pimeloyl-ACP methyl ester carboxylesterase